MEKTEAANRPFTGHCTRFWKVRLNMVTEYLINGEDTTIINAQGNSAIRESHMASDFLNYRMRTNLFNPGSHYDVYTPIFQNDLIRTIETLEQISRLTNLNL